MSLRTAAQKSATSTASLLRSWIVDSAAPHGARSAMVRSGQREGKSLGFNWIVSEGVAKKAAPSKREIAFAANTAPARLFSEWLGSTQATSFVPSAKGRVGVAATSMAHRWLVEEGAARLFSRAAMRGRGWSGASKAGLASSWLWSSGVVRMGKSILMGAATFSALAAAASETAAAGASEAGRQTLVRRGSLEALKAAGKLA
eukprot:CAMPEP_0206248568 /NCGR_PEP_ID=MMETSP0047_2-20121206/20440_1 /ASSEMBLY_ACC=CAM_ASM_000192 /TAXON_ID=195065 /ORGANISM="Chroomonas mesostigmatica_cf, Strain CCMP1168" /LENGTH=201 /DNA_ID=CAMNT_0053674223 /DNA_START=42 /DNA_END=647 /DNA_ORIENTATION=-